jgi:hypothetical protein
MCPRPIVARSERPDRNRIRPPLSSCPRSAVLKEPVRRAASLPAGGMERRHKNIMGKTAFRFGYSALALLALGAAATGHMIVQEIGEALAVGVDHSRR